MSGRWRIVTASALNLRGGPGIQHPILARLPQGAGLEVVESAGSWLRVRNVDQVGWVASSHTAPHRAPWLAVAEWEELRDVHELAGARENPRILQYHAATSLHATRDEVAWCSAFVNWCMLHVGLRGTGSAAARSWLAWGRAVLEPTRGCIAIFRRGGNPAHGHVAIYLGEERGEIRVLGGNQGNRVCEAVYPAHQLLGYRLPA